MKSRFLLVILCSILFWSCNTTQKVVEADHPPLVGTLWYLESIDNQYIDTTYQSKPYIVFDTTNQYHGNFGCNDFFGSYYVTKKRLQLTYSGATKKLCSNMAVERVMLKSLKADINTYSIRGDMLVLLSGNKEVMRFRSTK